MVEYKEEFTVYEDEWGTGVDSPEVLEDENGTKCCLGFYVEQVFGMDLHDFDGDFYYDAMDFIYREFSETERSNCAMDSTLNSAAVRANDNGGITKNEVKRILPPLFAKNGILINFNKTRDAES